MLVGGTSRGLFLSQLEAPPPGAMFVGGTSRYFLLKRVYLQPSLGRHVCEGRVALKPPLGRHLCRGRPQEARPPVPGGRWGLAPAASRELLRPPRRGAGSMAAPGPGPRRLVAAVQLTATDDAERNAAACERLVREAAARGAGLVCLPEAFAALGPPGQPGPAEPLRGALVRRCARLARACRVWLSLGGFRELRPGHGHGHGHSDSAGRAYNCHLLIGPDGSMAAAYRKIHLFDVELAGRVSLQESSYTHPGSDIAPPVSTSVGKVGLAICYDLRFPEISLALAREGAEILTFPSAFTETTGAAHWEVLLRARAIETQCYVVAAAQTGKHNEHRSSYGHTMVVDPWGRVIAQCQEGPGLCYAEIDLPYLHRLRQEMPLWAHRRPELYGSVGILKKAPLLHEAVETEADPCQPGDSTEEKQEEPPPITS